VSKGKLYLTIRSPFAFLCPFSVSLFFRFGSGAWGNPIPRHIDFGTSKKKKIKIKKIKKKKKEREMPYNKKEKT